MFLSSAEIARGTQGALLLLRRDPAAPLHFDNTFEACLRSFRVMLLVAPLHAVYMAINYSFVQVAADDWEIVIFEALHYVVDWLLYPVLFYEIARRYRWLDRYPRYIAALNWINLPATALLILGAVIETALPPATESSWPLILLIVLQGFLFYWFFTTTRMTLGVVWPIAVLLMVVVNWMPSYFLSLLVDRFLGVAPLATGG
jgi:hypothetical protein